MARPLEPETSAAHRRADVARPSAALVAVAAWFVPGAGHFLVGQTQKGFVFVGVLTVMFVAGLAFGGRLFPLQLADPLVLLAALGEWAVGLPRLAGAIGGLGRGAVTSVTYEYGNTFLISAGLLNALIVLDATDYARGRKAR
jgi:hypothetical protein